MILGFGTGSDFAWSSSGDYAVRNNFTISIFKGATNQQEISLKTDFTIEGIYGGTLLYTNRLV